MIVLPWSEAALLATNRNLGAGVPSGFRQEKYFWCVRIAVARTSGGKRQHIGVDRAGEHDRELDETRDLVEQPGIGLEHEPLGRSGRSRSFRIISLRRS